MERFVYNDKERNRMAEMKKKRENVQRISIVYGFGR